LINVLITKNMKVVEENSDMGGNINQSKNARYFGVLSIASTTMTNSM